MENVNTIGRRRFLQLGSVALAFPLAGRAREAIERKGDPRLRLALAAYSFRDHFSWFKGKPQESKDGREMDLFAFIDYCADHGCQGAELTAYFLPPDADRDYFNRLKRHAHLRGVSITGTAIGNNFSKPKGPELDRQIADAKRWIDTAALFAAPHIRFFAGEMHEFEEGRDRVENSIAALQECADYAGEYGMFVGVENHGAMTPELLLEIIRAVDSPWIGINLDTGNFFTDTPYEDLEKCAPYAVNVQVKANMQTPDREKYPADYKRVVSILKNANYQGYVTFEYEEEGPWENVPLHLQRLRREGVS